MLIGAAAFLSQMQSERTLSIQGAKGSGKDLLTQELVMYFLERRSKKFDRPYRLISNQNCVWNDSAEWKGIIDVRGSVFWLSEAGRYLRTWKYFENLYEFTRKLDVFLFLPSIRAPHADLAEYYCESVTFSQAMFGMWFCPVWRWGVRTGNGTNYGGWFVFIPSRSEVGIYDTDDLSKSTDEVLSWFGQTIEHVQRNLYGRDGIQEVAGGQEDYDADYQARIAQRYEQIALSLQEERRRK